MTATKLAVLYTVVHLLFVLESIGATRELCSRTFIHPDASMSRSAENHLCINHRYHTGELAGDGCRVNCRRYSWSEMAAIDRRKPLSCCMRGRNSVGVCLNGRCHSAGKSSQQARLLDYRKLKIRAVYFFIDRRGHGPPQNLRFKIIYVKPNADRVGSYYNNETMCISDFEKVRRVGKGHDLVEFDFTCKTLHVHKDASIKFVVEADGPLDDKLTFEGQDKLSELRSGPMDLKSEASSAYNPLEYEIEVLSSLGSKAEEQQH